MSFAADFAPTSENEAALVIRDLFEARRPISIHGGRTRSGLGRPVQADAAVTTVALTGVTLYEPTMTIRRTRLRKTSNWAKQHPPGNRVSAS